MIKIIGKIAVTLGCVLFVASALAPPWVKVLTTPQHKQVIPIGFYCVFSPPRQLPLPLQPTAEGTFDLWNSTIANPDRDVERIYSIQVDFTRLTLIWLVIAVIISGGLLMLRKKG